MLLDRTEIQAGKFIDGIHPDHLRPGSYDLSIGHILSTQPLNAAGVSAAAQDVVTHEQGYTLPPQGVVKVISKERVRLPTNVVGYALVKNSLSNSGILAINIGIIDPGYSGPIASTLINFGKNHYRIEPGDIFLRLSFHRLQQNSYDITSVPRYTQEEYASKTKKEVANSLSVSFLNVHALAGKAGDVAFGNFKRFITVWIPIIGLGLVILTMLVPVGAEITSKLLGAWTIREAITIEVQKQLSESQIEVRLDAVEQSVRLLEVPVSKADVPEGAPDAGVESQ